MPQAGRYRVVAVVINGKAKYAVKVEDTTLSTHDELKFAIRRAKALKNAEEQGIKFTKASAKAGIHIGKKLGKKVWKHILEIDKPKKKRKSKRRKGR